MAGRKERCSCSGDAQPIRPTTRAQCCAIGNQGRRKEKDRKEKMERRREQKRRGKEYGEYLVDRPGDPGASGSGIVREEVGQ